MKTVDPVKQDYLDYCARFGYQPYQMDWRALYARDIKERIIEERISAKRQGAPDPVIDGKSDDEVANAFLLTIRKDPPDGILQPIVREIQRNAKRLNYAFPYPFYCGHVPFFLFNAATKRTKSGAIIVVYAELILFIYNVLKVFCLSVPMEAHTSYNEDKDTTTTIEPFLARADAIQAMVHLVTGFVNSRSGIRSSGPPLFGAQGGAIADRLIDLSMSTIRFVIAHECGHILAGHRLARIANLSPPYSDTETGIIAQLWEEEKLADQYGMDLCLAPAWPMNGTLRRLHDAATRLAGPFIFFAMDDFLSKAWRCIEKPQEITDHPPSLLRANVMRSWVRQISVNADLLLTTGNLFVSWLNGVSDEVLTKIS